MNIYNKQFETLILDDEDLMVTASGVEGSPFEVTGSDDMEYMAELYDYLDSYQIIVTDFNQKYIQARQSGDVDFLQRVTDEVMVLEAKKINKLKEMAWRFEGSLVSLLITDYISNKEDEYSFLDSLSTKLQKKLPNSNDVKFFASQLENFRPAVDIDIAPGYNITQT